MIEFELSVDVLGNTRFAFSPLAEVGASLRLLHEARPEHLHAPWVQRVRPGLVEADMELLLAITRPGRWAPAFLYPRAEGLTTTIEGQLDALAGYAPAALADDLLRVADGRDLHPRVAELLDLGEGSASFLAEVLERYWSVALAPFWPRARGVLEEDVAHRISRSMTAGLFELLADLHPSVTLHGGRLSIDIPLHSDATYEGGALTLVPSVFVWPRLVLTHTHPGAFELTYAARGVGRIWDDLDADSLAESSLGPLLGRTRATILALVSVPMSTTQLARTLGQSPGSVNQHLSVLRDGGMVTRRRSGRSVLYQQTALGTSLAMVAGAGHHSARAADA